MKVKTTPTPAAPKRADAHCHTASCKEECGVALRLIASHENIASESADDSTGHMQFTGLVLPKFNLRALLPRATSTKPTLEHGKPCPDPTSVGEHKLP